MSRIIPGSPANPRMSRGRVAVGIVLVVIVIAILATVFVTTLNLSRPGRGLGTPDHATACTASSDSCEQPGKGKGPNGHD